jgi:hypothetical protein
VLIYALVTSLVIDAQGKQHRRNVLAAATPLRARAQCVVLRALAHCRRFSAPFFFKQFPP